MTKLQSALITGALAAGAVLCPAPAGAYETIQDGGTANCNTVYQFTAPVSGTLEISTDFRIMLSDILFSSPEHTQESALAPFNTVYSESGYSYYYRIAEATDYYFFYDYVSVDGKSPKFHFSVTEGELPNEISRVTPEPTTAVEYNFTFAPNLEINFLLAGVLTGTASVEYETPGGDTASIPLFYERVEKGTVYPYEFALKDAIQAVKDRIRPYSVFTVVIADPKIDGVPVTGRYVTESGNIELSYLYAPFTSITDVRYPDTFLSFWPENAADGVLIFSFDGPLAPLDKQTAAALTIFAGPYSDGGEDYGGWATLPGAPIEIEGNTLRVNLCGVQRLTEEEEVTIRITGIVDQNKQPVDYYGTNVLQISRIPYALVKNGLLSYEITPAAGSLEGVSSIELYVGAESFEMVEIEGFRFTAEGMQPVEITVGETNPSESSLDPGSVTYTIPVPEIAQTTPDVTFSAVLKSLNGYENSISAVYNTADNAVGSIGADKADGICYDLQGRRVEAPSKGLYIQKGRKTVITGTK